MTLRLRNVLVAIALSLLGAAAVRAELVPENRPRTDLYGDPLPAGAVARFGTTRWKHAGSVRDVVFTPDGKTLASVGDRTLRLWDTATGRELRRFVVHKSAVRYARFFPDGKTLVTSGEGTIRFWDVATGKERHRIDATSKGITALGALALAPDGKTLAAGGRNGDRKVYLWETATGKLLRSWPAHADEVRALAFSPNGKLLVSGGESRVGNPGRFETICAAVAWDPTTGKKRWEIGRQVRVPARAMPDDPDPPDSAPLYETLNVPARVVALAFSPDGKLLATGGYDPLQWRWAVRLWDSATGKEHPLPDRKSDTSDDAFADAIAFSPDGKLMAAQDGRNLVVWDLVRGIRLEVKGILPQVVGPTFHTTDIINALAFSPDGKMLACGCHSGAIRLWDVIPGKAGEKVRLIERSVSRGHPWPINAVAVSPDGRQGFSAGYGGKGRLWEMATGKEVRTLGRIFEGIRCAAYSPDGKLLATGQTGPDGVSLWDPDTGKRLRALDDAPHKPVSVAFQGSKTLVAHGVGSDLVFWDVTTGKEIRTLGDRPEGFGLRPALSPDGRTVGTTYDSGLFLWNATTGTLRQRLPAGRFQAGVFSPDGLVIASVGEEVRLWDVTAGLEIGRLQGGLHPCDHYYDAPVVYSPDGRFVAAAEFVVGEIGAHLWSVETGKDVFLDGGQGQVTAIAFSPDGRYFLTAGEDCNVLVWDVARLTGAPARLPPPTAAQARQLIANLQGQDSLRAFQAYHRLLRAPGKVVTVLRDRLHPVPPADPERLTRLLKQLDSDTFAERERASAALRQLGPPADAALERALAGNPSPEVRRRINLLLKDLEQARKGRRTDWSVRLLERIGTAEARALLQALAGGAPGAPLTEDARAALKRMSKTTGKRP